MLTVECVNLNRIKELKSRQSVECRLTNNNSRLLTNHTHWMHKEITKLRKCIIICRTNLTESKLYGWIKIEKRKEKVSDCCDFDCSTHYPHYDFIELAVGIRHSNMHINEIYLFRWTYMNLFKRFKWYSAISILEHIDISSSHQFFLPLEIN